MGSTSFSNTVEGRTADEAFRKAVDHARHEHGHGGYTGTIAEKSDFVMVRIDPTKLKAAMGKAKERLQKHLENLNEGLKSPLDQWGYHKVPGSGSQMKPEQLRKSIEKVEATLRDEKLLTENALTIYADELIESSFDADSDGGAGDKWGPALCIELMPAQPIKPMTKAEALKRVVEKHGPGAEVDTRRSGGRTTATVSVVKNGVRTIGPYGCSEGKDAAEAYGALFASPGRYLFFGSASC